MTTTHEEFDSIAALDAVGAATPDEENALRAHLAGCADCRRARDEYGDAASLLARALDPVAPPRDVRERVIDLIADDGDADVVDINSRRGFNRWWLATAATVFLAMWGWREIGIRVAREHVVNQQAELKTLTEQNVLLQQQKEKLASEMQALGSAGTKTIALTGQTAAPAASARVFLVPERRRAIVFFSSLPENPKDKSYQLWIIRADQPKPQSAGVFDATHGSATITIENLPVETEIKALAVTLEPRGGVEQPTNTDFFVMGKT
jgi:anti-sigma-K factor RskA